MKILIVFYSRNGHTKKVATDLANSLKANIDEIIDLKKRSGIWGWIKACRDGMKGNQTEIKTSKDPSKYDLILIGTPVWAGGISPAIRTYITKYQKDFNKIGGFMTSGGEEPQKIITILENILENKKLKIFEAWSGDDLKNNATYQEKMDKFVEKIRELR